MESFGGNSSSVVDEFIDEWNLTVDVGDTHKSFGDLDPTKVNPDEKELVNCSVVTPIPCDHDSNECLATLTLYMIYKEVNTQ